MISWPTATALTQYQADVKFHTVFTKGFIKFPNIYNTEQLLFVIGTLTPRRQYRMLLKGSFKNQF